MGLFSKNWIKPSRLYFVSTMGHDYKKKGDSVLNGTYIIYLSYAFIHISISLVALNKYI